MKNLTRLLLVSVFFLSANVSSASCKLVNMEQRLDTEVSSNSHYLMASAFTITKNCGDGNFTSLRLMFSATENLGRSVMFDEIAELEKILQGRIILI